MNRALPNLRIKPVPGGGPFNVTSPRRLFHFISCSSQVKIIPAAKWPTAHDADAHDPCIIKLVAVFINPFRNQWASVSDRKGVAGEVFMRGIKRPAVFLLNKFGADVVQVRISRREKVLIFRSQGFSKLRRQSLFLSLRSF